MLQVLQLHRRQLPALCGGPGGAPGRSLEARESSGEEGLGGGGRVGLVGVYLSCFLCGGGEGGGVDG